jgi:hypothetical protein
VRSKSNNDSCAGLFLSGEFLSNFVRVVAEFHNGNNALDLAMNLVATELRRKRDWGSFFVAPFPRPNLLRRAQTASHACPIIAGAPCADASVAMKAVIPQIARDAKRAESRRVSIRAVEPVA